jgi:hypothetical protein
VQSGTRHKAGQLTAWPVPHLAPQTQGSQGRAAGASPTCKPASPTGNDAIQHPSAAKTWWAVKAMLLLACSFLGLKALESFLVYSFQAAGLSGLSGYRDRYDTLPFESPLFGIVRAPYYRAAPNTGGKFGTCAPPATSTVTATAAVPATSTGPGSTCKAVPSAADWNKPAATGLPPLEMTHIS